MKNKLKDFTVNVDIQIIAKNTEEMNLKLNKILRNNKYWLGDITEREVK